VASSGKLIELFPKENVSKNFSSRFAHLSTADFRFECLQVRIDCKKKTIKEKLKNLTLLEIFTVEIKYFQILFDYKKAIKEKVNN